MPEIDQTLLSELLSWYRLQRHDCLNHFQVVKGYLQLNREDKALEYMQGMLLELQAEQMIAQIPSSLPAAILLGWVIRLRTQDVSADLSFPDGMKKEEFWDKRWREEYAEALYGYTIECLSISEELANKNTEKLQSEIYLYEEQAGFSAEFILYCGEQELVKKAIKFPQ